MRGRADADGHRRPAASGRAPRDGRRRFTCPRRALVAGIGAAAAAGLAGCLGGDGDEEVPAEPIDLSGGQTCEVCGMVIGENPGPAGQLYYEGGRPDGGEEPARFDSVAELVTFHDEQVARGAELRAAFVTDYSAVDYDLETVDDATYVTSHVTADAFADATDLSYVVGSDVEGAMGPEYVPFSDPADAEAFADDHGGDVRSWDDLPTRPPR